MSRLVKAENNITGTMDCEFYVILNIGLDDSVFDMTQLEVFQLMKDYYSNALIKSKEAYDYAVKNTFPDAYYACLPIHFDRHLYVEVNYNNLTDNGKKIYQDIVDGNLSKDNILKVITPEGYDTWEEWFEDSLPSYEDNDQVQYNYANLYGKIDDIAIKINDKVEHFKLDSKVTLGEETFGSITINPDLKIDDIY